MTLWFFLNYISRYLCVKYIILISYLRRNTNTWKFELTWKSCLGWPEILYNWYISMFCVNFDVCLWIFIIFPVIYVLNFIINSIIINYLRIYKCELKTFKIGIDLKILDDLKFLCERYINLLSQIRWLCLSFTYSYNTLYTVNWIYSLSYSKYNIPYLKQKPINHNFNICGSNNYWIRWKIY